MDAPLQSPSSSHPPNALDWSQFPLFAGCSPAQIEPLLLHAQTVACKRNQTLYSEGDPVGHVHVVLEGEIALEKRRGPDEEPMRLSIVRPGECFGIGEFMLPAYVSSATALANAKLLRISADLFRKRFLAVEPIRDWVLAELSRIANYLLFAVVSGSGARMLAFYLRRLCLENSTESNGQFRIQTKVLQPHVASLLNMSREHVTRLFARLQEQGAVDFNRGFPIVDKRWLQSAVTDTDLADFIVYRDYPQ